MRKIFIKDICNILLLCLNKGKPAKILATKIKAYFTSIGKGFEIFLQHFLSTLKNHLKKINANEAR